MNTPKHFFKVLLLLLTLTKVVSGQGLNNDYQIDQTDLKAILAIQNMEVYKFPFQEPASVKYINIIFEEYENGERKTIDLCGNDKMKSVIKTYGKDMVVPNIQKGKENILRFYLKRSDTTLLVHFILNQQQSTLDFSFPDGIKIFGSRAFSVDYQSLKGKVRILSFYGTKNTDQPTHCAMEDNDVTLSKRFDYVLSVYIEPYH